jgi:diguanylate cyclase (GGDEF)-like protein
MSSPSYLPNYSKWNRTVLTSYWVILLLYIISKLLNIFIFYLNVDGFPLESYLLYEAALPAAILSGIMIVLEVILRKKPDITELSIVIGVHLFALTIVYFIDERVYLSPVIMIFPLLSSLLYLKRKYIMFSLTVSMFYSAFNLIFTPQIDHVSLSAFAIITSMLVCTSFTGFGIIRRGSELLAILEKSMKSEQELLIKNVVMDRLSKIDPLTDLYNHKTFHEYLEKLIEHQHMSHFPFQLAVMDIDNFKKVNDTYGHWVGDIALKQVAARVLEHMGSDDFAARYGGEEFVLLLTLENVESAYQTIEIIREAIASTPIHEMEDKTVTVSIGLHAFKKGDTKEKMFQLADKALYEAKKTGKNKTIQI